LAIKRSLAIKSIADKAGDAGEYTGYFGASLAVIAY
jgi:hypothetical protein